MKPTITQSLLACCFCVCFITTNGQLAVNITPTNPTSCTTNNGSATANPSGCTSSYSYQWSTGATTATVNGLGAGTYTVTVYCSQNTIDTVYFEDFDGTNAWTLNTPTGLNGSQANQWWINDDEGGQPAGQCTTANNGDSSLFIGVHPTLYGILSTGAAYFAGPGTTCQTNKAAASDIFSTAGMSNMTLSFQYTSLGDSGFDFASVYYSTGGPPIVLAPNFSLSTPCGLGFQWSWNAFSMPLPAGCNNQPTFAIGFNWINNTDNAGSDPAVAINNVLITRPIVALDSVVASVTLTNNSSLAINAANVVVNHPVCGQNNGLITGINASGGNGNYSYQWDSAGVVISNNANATNLFAGTYHVVITEFGTGCTVDTSITLVPTGVPNMNYQVSDSLLCSGQQTTLQVLNPPAAGIFTWSGPNISPAINNAAYVVTPPSTQPYFFTWTDGQCSITDTLWVTVNTPPTLSLNTNTPVVCAGDTAVLVATGATGGTYTWSGGDLSNPVSGATINVAPTSTQTYTVDWQNGTCMGSSTQSIYVMDPSASLLSNVNPSCGLNNGSISCSGSAFSPQFSWIKDGTAFPGTSNTLNNLGPGTYVMVLTDAVTGCSDSVLNIVLTDPTTLFVWDSVVIQNVSCFGLSDGAIDVYVSSGSGTYSYSWNPNVSNTANASALAAGSYTVTVDDGICPPRDTTVSVSSPINPLSVNASVVTADNCQQGQGVAVATAGSGTAPYNYNWSNGAVIDTAYGLTGGTAYNVTATDSMGCTATANVVMQDIGAPVLSFTAHDSICEGNTNGEIEIFPPSQGGPFSYQWSHDGSNTSSLADSLSVGTYTVTVTNSSGCSATVSVTIYEYSGGTMKLYRDTTIYEGATVFLHTITNVDYYDANWNPAVIPFGQNMAAAYVQPDDTTTYYLELVYGDGCVLLDSVTVNVRGDDSLVVPNAFTPNNDAHNDYFYVKAEGIETIEVNIFDRWGNKVYYSDEVNFKWDGTDMFAGYVPRSTGVFVYIIEYTNYGSFERKVVEGNITLIR